MNSNFSLNRLIVQNRITYKQPYIIMEQHNYINRAIYRHLKNKIRRKYILIKAY